MSHRTALVGRVVLLTAALNLALVTYGILSYPKVLNAGKATLLGLVADIIIFSLYALAGIYGTQVSDRLCSEAVRVGAYFGIAVTVVYLLVVEGEYMVRVPASRAGMLGMVMVVAVFSLFLLAGIGSAYRAGQILAGTLAAVWSALIGTGAWFSIVMFTYYAFLGTAQQEYVLKLENHDDFVRSGMTDFRAFVLQDFMGAGFYHLLISPLFAGILGSIGGVMGIGARRAQERSRLTR